MGSPHSLHTQSSVLIPTPKAQSSLPAPHPGLSPHSPHTQGSVLTSPIPRAQSSSPARLPIQGPTPPFASTRAPLALPPSREPSHFLLPLPALPSSPPASSHMTGRAPPHDVTDVRAPAPGLPPTLHAWDGRLRGERGPRAQRSPTRACQSAAAAAAERGARVPGCAALAEAPPPPPARARPRLRPARCSAPLSPPSPPSPFFVP